MSTLSLYRPSYVLTGDKRSKRFFFEKKNQKTFVFLRARCRNLRDSMTKSLLLLFFRKEGFAFPARLRRVKFQGRWYYFAPTPLAELLTQAGCPLHLRTIHAGSVRNQVAPTPQHCVAEPTMRRFGQICGLCGGSWQTPLHRSRPAQPAQTATPSRQRSGISRHGSAPAGCPQRLDRGRTPASNPRRRGPATPRRAMARLRR